MLKEGEEAAEGKAGQGLRTARRTGWAANLHREKQMLFVDVLQPLCRKVAGQQFRGNGSSGRVKTERRGLQILNFWYSAKSHWPRSPTNTDGVEHHPDT